ncbi:dipeptide/oligopeptide/nickel ABC transporter ATP-binding protein, partial [Brevibacillus sp. SIMBA_076]
MTLAENQPQMTDLPEKETILELKNIQKHFPIKAGILQKKVGAVKAVD